MWLKVLEGGKLLSWGRAILTYKAKGDLKSSIVLKNTNVALSYVSHCA